MSESDPFVITIETLFEWVDDPATYERPKRRRRPSRRRPYRKPREPEPDYIQILFGAENPVLEAENRSEPARENLEGRESGFSGEEPDSPARESPRGESEAVLGIDLADKFHDIRKLTLYAYGSRIRRYGYDAEDVVQEIYAGLLVRNAGRCPFDPRKATFARYVIMVAGCILSNYHRKHGRIARREQLGIHGFDESDSFGLVDVRDAQVEDSRAFDAFHEGSELAERLDALLDAAESTQEVLDALRVAPWLAEEAGLGRTARETGMSAARVRAGRRLLAGVGSRR